MKVLVVSVDTRLLSGLCQADRGQRLHARRRIVRRVRHMSGWKRCVQVACQRSEACRTLKSLRRGHVQLDKAKVPEPSARALVVSSRALAYTNITRPRSWQPCRACLIIAHVLDWGRCESGSRVILPFWTVGFGRLSPDRRQWQEILRDNNIGPHHNSPSSPTTRTSPSWDRPPCAVPLSLPGPRTLSWSTASATVWACDQAPRPWASSRTVRRQ